MMIEESFIISTPEELTSQDFSNTRFCLLYFQLNVICWRRKKERKQTPFSENMHKNVFFVAAALTETENECWNGQAQLELGLKLWNILDFKSRKQTAFKVGKKWERLIIEQLFKMVPRHSA